MYIEDKDIHKGHRTRMRAKLEAHGMRIFDTYELLEMLLYYAIPHRDTNPMAKRLLAEFGSLDGVFRAPKEALAAVDGIGPKCAELILLAGKVLDEDSSLADKRRVLTFDDYHDTGRYLVSHFEECGASACMLMLDNGMRLIDILDVNTGDFGSAAVKPKLFMGAVLSAGASVVILAHKRHSLLYFSDSVLATDRLVRSELSFLDVTVAEHYVVCGKDYAGLRANYTLGASADAPALEKFLNSIPRNSGGDDAE